MSSINYYVGLAVFVKASFSLMKLKSYYWHIMEINSRLPAQNELPNLEQICQLHENINLVQRKMDLFMRKVSVRRNLVLL